MEESSLPPPRPSPTERVREMWDDYRHLFTPARLLMAGAGLAVGIVVLVFVLAGNGGASRPEAVIPRATPLPATATPTPEPTSIQVHAAGAVHIPGLYRFWGEPRVYDLVNAAGGLTPDADYNRVNLAAPVLDGQRVYFPRLGETDIPAPVNGTGPAGGASAVRPGPVNINTATATELDTLPGIGPAYAAAIIKHREQIGGFTSVDGLLAVSGIGPSTLEQIRELVTV